jgi:hypothetical protein
MKATTKHIRRERTDVTLNALLVQETCGIDELEYNTIQFELGIQFIQKTFNEGSEEYLIFSRSPSFWRWFKAEYHQWEQSTLEYLIKHEIKTNTAIYRNEMKLMLYHNHTLNGFIEFVKIYKNRI